MVIGLPVICELEQLMPKISAILGLMTLIKTRVSPCYAQVPANLIANYSKRIKTEGALLITNIQTLGNE